MKSKYKTWPEFNAANSRPDLAAEERAGGHRRRCWNCERKTYTRTIFGKNICYLCYISLTTNHI